MTSQDNHDVYKEFKLIIPRRSIKRYIAVELMVKEQLKTIILRSSVKLNLYMLQSECGIRILTKLIETKDPLILTLCNLSAIDLSTLLDCVKKGKRFNPDMRMLIVAEAHRRIQINKDYQFVLYNTIIDGNLKEYLEKQAIVYNKSEEELIKILDLAKSLDDRPISLNDEDEYFYYRKFITKLFSSDKANSIKGKLNSNYPDLDSEINNKKSDAYKIYNSVKKLVESNLPVKEAIFEVSKSEKKNIHTVKTNYYYYKNVKKFDKSLKTQQKQT